MMKGSAHIVSGYDEELWALTNDLTDLGTLVSEMVNDAMYAFKQCDSTFCLLYTSPSPRDRQKSRMPSSA